MTVTGISLEMAARQAYAAAQEELKARLTAEARVEAAYWREALQTALQRVLGVFYRGDGDAFGRMTVDGLTFGMQEGRRGAADTLQWVTTCAAAGNWRL